MRTHRTHRAHLINDLQPDGTLPWYVEYPITGRQDKFFRHFKIDFRRVRDLSRPYGKHFHDTKIQIVARDAIRMILLVTHAKDDDNIYDLPERVTYEESLILEAQHRLGLLK